MHAQYWLQEEIADSNRPSFNSALLVVASAVEGRPFKLDGGKHHEQRCLALCDAYFLHNAT